MFSNKWSDINFRILFSKYLEIDLLLGLLGPIQNASKRGAATAFETVIRCLMTV